MEDLEDCYERIQHGCFPGNLVKFPNMVPSKKFLKKLSSFYSKMIGWVPGCNLPENLLCTAQYIAPNFAGPKINS